MLSEALNNLEGISLSQFADDSAIWTKHSSAGLAIKKLQKALNMIEAWGTVLGDLSISSQDQGNNFQQKN